MIESDAIEAVFECETPLYFVRLDHRGQHIAHHQRGSSARDVGATDIVSNRENSSKIVGRMSPLSGEPGVVEIEPANHAADVPGSLHRIELELCSRNPGTIRYNRPWYEWTEVF